MRWLCLLTAPLWSFAFFLWCRSGFGLHPIIRVTGSEALNYTMVVTGPFWILAIAGTRHTYGSAWLRLMGVPLAGWPFAVAPGFIASMVIFFPLDQQGWWLAANLLLFRLPFMLAFVCLLHQCALIAGDIRVKAHVSPARAPTMRRRLPGGGYW